MLSPFFFMQLVEIASLGGEQASDVYSYLYLLFNNLFLAETTDFKLGDY